MLEGVLADAAVETPPIRTPPGAPKVTRLPGTDTVEAAASIIIPAIAASANDDGLALLANVGWSIVNNNPTFDSRNYGYDKLSALVRTINAVETKIEPDDNKVGQLWARLKPHA